MKASAPFHFRINGILYDSTITNRESLEKLGDYDDIRDDDVVVWTYPKSGSWVRAHSATLVCHLTARAAATAAFELAAVSAIILSQTLR